MDTSTKKAAQSAYRERKQMAGIYALKCAASDEIWVGAAPDLATIQNRNSFTLKMGSHSSQSLQRAYAAHGGDSLGFVVLERLPLDESGAVDRALLKRRAAHWRAELRALPL